MQQQFVCIACGYNMIGECPDTCPFCGAGRESILSSEECSRRYAVESTVVTDHITQLMSVPRLGIEHAAYRVETGTKVYWIDCLSSYDQNLPRADVISFTHPDFLGASNQYRERFGADVWIHKLDAEHPLAQPFPFDRLFDKDFSADGITAHHVNGHTPGYTVYLFDDALFVCDLVITRSGEMQFNPYGDPEGTCAAGRKLDRLLQERSIRHVCGYNYVASYDDWKPRFDQLLNRSE